MKKTFNLLLILVFSLTLSHPLGFTAKDRGLEKLQSWLKGLDINYSIQELKALTHLRLKGNPLSEKEKKKIKKLLPRCDIIFE